MSNALKRPGLSKQPAGQGGSGAVDEDVFFESFEQVPSLIVCSFKDVLEHIDKIKTSLNVSPEEWEKRVDGLKRLRGLIIAEAAQYSEFYTQLRDLTLPVQSCISDLRSLVVREACITVAFVAYKLTSKAERFLEMLMDALIALIQNSAKVISTSGITALSIIVTHSYSPRYIPIFTKELSSKSSITRRYVCEVLRIMCANWPTHILERYLGPLQESIKKGLNDADQDARAASRNMFLAFHSNFPEQANELLNSLNPSKRRLLEKELGLPDSSSLSSSAGASSLKSSSQSNLSATAAKQPRIAKSNTTTQDPTTGTATLLRHVPSASTADRLKKAGVSTSRTAGRRIGIQSQPASRDTSPHRSTSNLSTAGTESHSSSTRGGLMKAPRPAGPPPTSRTRPGLYAVKRNIVNAAPGKNVVVPPRSQGASRDGSPSRDLPEPWNVVMGSVAVTGANVANTNGVDAEAVASRLRRSSYSDNRNKMFIDQSSEQGLSDALTRGVNRRRGGGEDVDDNASEISSAASDAPYTGQPSKIVDTVPEILTLLQSGAWKDRRDALLNFQLYLRDGKPLRHGEIQKLSEIFTRLFNDTKGKVFITLLDTIQLFMEEYHSYLSSWLYILLVRLLTKQGNDLLSSHQEAIQETLNVVRSTFRCSLQFQNCCKFLQDATQTPNLRTKNTLLVFMQSLLTVCSAEDVYGDVTSNDLVMAFAKIINYTMEPKSPEIRKNTEEVMWRLFDLDPNRWNSIVASLGKSFQENAMRVIHRRVTVSSVSSATAAAAGDNNNCKVSASPSPYLSNENTLTSPSTLGFQQRLSETRRGSLPTSPTNKVPSVKSTNLNAEQMPADPPQRRSLLCPSTRKNVIANRRLSASSLLTLPRNVTKTPTSSGGRTSIPRSAIGSSSTATSARPQPLTPASLLNNNNVPTTPKSAFTETNSSNTSNAIRQITEGLQSLSMSHISDPYVARAAKIPQQTPAAASLIPMPMLDSASHIPHSHPQHEDVFLPNKTGVKRVDGVSDLGPDDILGDVLQNLSNHNEKNEHRKQCMSKLGHIIRSKSPVDWEEYFKTTLFLLLEILGDAEVDLRAQSLRVLQDLIVAEPQRFEEYTHLTIMKILEAHRDSQKVVSTAAEECAKAVAQILPSAVLLSVLHPIILDSDSHIITAAVKMLQHHVAVSEVDVVREIFQHVTPALIKACNDSSSQIRKCAVFCLVEFYFRIGDETLKHLQEMGFKPDKMRLLQLFIDRRNESSALPKATTSRQ